MIVLPCIPAAYRRLSVAALAALTSVSAFAQSAAEVDLSAAENFASDLSSALVDFVNDHLIVAVVAVLASVVGLLLAYRVIRWLIRALSGR